MTRLEQVEEHARNQATEINHLTDQMDEVLEQIKHIATPFDKRIWELKQNMNTKNYFKIGSITLIIIAIVMIIISGIKTRNEYRKQVNFNTIDIAILQAQYELHGIIPETIEDYKDE